MAKEKILVVDDEEDILELLKYNLNREGYKVVSASSGEKCLQKAASEKPDLIVLDLMLPGIDGLEVTKILKSDSKTLHIPIIMLTAKGEEADIVAGLELGADDYITKPFSPRILIARVRAVIRRKDKSKKDNDLETIQIHNILI
ncbi:MAG: response regulator, partial [Proteobacteria bacterium]|nr:response regulator [Pseudomonadota bacterium]